VSFVNLRPHFLQYLDFALLECPQDPQVTVSAFVQAHSGSPCVAMSPSPQQPCGQDLLSTLGATSSCQP
jgi:hypothetical protein